MNRVEKSLMTMLLAVPCMSAHAYLETFESQTNNAHSFNSNGTVFAIGSPFYIQGSYPGTGWNGSADDNKYIDNSGAVTNTGIDFSIKTQDASQFSVQSVWLFLSSASLDLTVTGSLTLKGKIAGNTVFMAGPVSSGFNQSMSVANGYSFIDLRTFGGHNNSNVLIDELEVVTTPQYNYISFDALTWSNITDRIFQSTFE